MVSGNDQVRVFEVGYCASVCLGATANGAKLTLNELTVANGR